MSEATIRGTLRPQTIRGIPVAGSYTGVTEHSALNGRDIADQHPIGAITGLQDALDDKISQETDPTVPAWAKQISKPNYAATEIAYGSTTVSAELTTHTNGIASVNQAVDALELATILIDSQGKFYVKQEDD